MEVVELKLAAVSSNTVKENMNPKVKEFAKNMKPKVKKSTKNTTVICRSILQITENTVLNPWRRLANLNG